MVFRRPVEVLAQHTPIPLVEALLHILSSDDFLLHNAPNIVGVKSQDSAHFQVVEFDRLGRGLRRLGFVPRFLPKSSLENNQLLFGEEDALGVDCFREEFR